MRFRKLRIAWSVACGIACVLLIVLWVRSYWWFDISHAMKPTLVSARGKLFLTNKIEMTLSPSLEDLNAPQPFGRNRFIRGFSYTIEQVEVERASYIAVVPIWILVLTFAGFAVLPWLRWRFTTRTLLIVITAVAVMLGVVVYLAR
jgi:hypothetical protein